MTAPGAEWAQLAHGLRAGLTAAGATAVEVGPTPRRAVWTRRGATLWHYGRGGDGAVPLLIVYSLVNRPYLLDLEPGRSLIGALVDQGVDAYLLDWGVPGPGDAGLSLETYVGDYLNGAVAEIVRRSDRADLDLLGVCQGGTLALCYAALEPARIRRLVTMVTPVDFATPNDAVADYARALDVEGLAAAFGNIPGEFLRLGFQSLKPLGNTLGKLLALADAGAHPASLATHLRVERWIRDSPDLAGTALVQFVQHFYRDNALAARTLRLCGSTVALSAIRAPVLNVHATRDHLVPSASALALGPLLASRRYRAAAFEGGHLGAFISSRAQRELPPMIAAFLKARR